MSSDRILRGAGTMRLWGRLASLSRASWSRSLAGGRSVIGGSGHGVDNSRLRRGTEIILEQRAFCSGQSLSTRPVRKNGVHVFQCSDQLGVVAAISQKISRRGANILNVDIYIDFDDHGAPIFYSRSEFSFDPLQWPRKIMNEDFAEISRYFKAHTSIVRVPGIDEEMKTVILTSRQDHCLVDLLHRWQEGGLPAQISAVISNHDRGPNTHVGRFLDRHGIPYHYLPTTRVNKKEEEILEVVGDTDFLVLARYMQVLSPDFLTRYGKDIINIHHGLLPSFKGANPYRQAYQAGVKLIGATAHFVTPELDEGPIIEQMVDHVSHRDTLQSFAMKSENLEKQCLAKAIKYYCEHRIIRYSCNKTIIFS